MLRISHLSILLGFVICSEGSRGGGPTPEIPPDLILERFAISKRGDVLLVPVRVAGKEYEFLVDTGFSRTVFDTSLLPRHPIDDVTVLTTEGSSRLRRYPAPDAQVGRTPLGPLDAVLGMDLKPLNRTFGIGFRGILGMDFLGNYAVHIDIDRSRLLLLKATPSGLGDRLPMTWVPGQVAYVWAEVAPGERIRFEIDTGAIGFTSGTLGVLEAASLTRMGRGRKIGRSLTGTASGNHVRATILCDCVTIGGFAVKSPIFSESLGPRSNKLGLNFWSRFVVTFDFPGRNVYLRETPRLRLPDRWNTRGLYLVTRGDLIEVDSVDDGSPAAGVGLKGGDVLIELDGLNARELGLFRLYSELRLDGELPLVIRRDERELRLILRPAIQGE